MVREHPGGRIGVSLAEDLDADLLAEVLAVFRDDDEPAVSFTDRDPEGFDFVIAAAASGAMPARPRGPLPRRARNSTVSFWSAA